MTAAPTAGNPYRLPREVVPSRYQLTLQPDLSGDHVEKNTVFANPSDRSRFLLGLRNAGLKG